MILDQTRYEMSWMIENADKIKDIKLITNKMKQTG